MKYVKSSSCSKDYKILSSIFFMNLLNYSNRIVPIVPLHFPHGKYFDETLMSIIPLISSGYVKSSNHQFLATSKPYKYEYRNRKTDKNYKIFYKR